MGWNIAFQYLDADTGLNRKSYQWWLVLVTVRWEASINLLATICVCALCWLSWFWFSSNNFCISVEFLISTIKGYKYIYTDGRDKGLGTQVRETSSTRTTSPCQWRTSRCCRHPEYGASAPSMAISVWFLLTKHICCTTISYYVE